MQNPPPEIGNLKSLLRLSLSGNALLSLPAEIGNLKDLIILDLNGTIERPNQFFWLPVEICNLEELYELNLSSNYLDSLPSEISKLQNLRELNIESNRLGSLPVEAMQKMPNLRRLSLKVKDNKGNPLKPEYIEALRSAMPWCEIVWEE